MYFYIAGKVNGLDNYKEYFDEAEGELCKFGHVCMNPSVLPEGFPWEAYMPICYAMIDCCDAVFMLKNWKDSKGAKLEHEYAKQHHKIIVYQ